MNSSIELLKSLIRVPSFSRSEEGTAAVLLECLSAHGAKAYRHKQNVYAVAPGYDPSRPTLMLNAHHDTVRPAPSYSFDPFTPQVRDGRVYGLGSNDDGGSVVALTRVFLDYKDRVLPFNLVLALTAEEEVGGVDGMRSLLPHLQEQDIAIDMAIVGEPTGMQAAVAERGLVVMDCTSHGVSGHAARSEGVNAIYKAMRDIEALRTLKLPRVSPVLGPVKITVTQIEAGTQHNVVPDSCRFVVDMRTTDAYTNEESVELVRRAVEADVVPRSTRIRASVIDASHPLVQAAVQAGRTTYISPTTSDMSGLPGIPSMKIGPGESSRSHTADEFIEISEIEEGVRIYSLILDILSQTLA